MIIRILSEETKEKELKHLIGKEMKKHKRKSVIHIGILLWKVLTKN